MGSGRALAPVGPMSRVITALAIVMVLTTCDVGSDADGAAGTAPSTRPTASPGGSSSSPTPSAALPLPCNGARNIPSLWFGSADGTRLYGAIVGSGSTGVVVANDVPHPLCETLVPARFLAAHGYRVLVFDYRDHEDSDTSDVPGRLDRDVAGAVAELRSRGVQRVVLLGSYAGVAAAVVAATEIRPDVDGIVGISPAAYRGHWVEGPFGPIGALQAAPKLRMPALFVTVRTDPYVSLGEVRRLYRSMASRDKDLLVIPSGSAGFETIDFNSYGDRVRSAILSFVERIAGRNAGA
jgi:pimeloyl-ACP methyl ester carboxylesterase